MSVKDVDWICKYIIFLTLNKFTLLIPLQFLCCPVSFIYMCCWHWKLIKVL
jgi:hypothetical protein